MCTLASREDAAQWITARESASRHRRDSGPMAPRMEVGKTLRVRFTCPAAAVLAFLALPLAGCHVAAPYVKPKIEIPPSYKELRSPGSQALPLWKQSEPKDDAVRASWWEVFNDTELNELQEKANISNQNISAAAASYLAARASIREARSHYYPTLTVDSSIINSRPSPGQFGGLRATGLSNATLSVTSYTNYSLLALASWEPDLWNRVRLSTKKSYIAAQVSAADLENVRLATHAELAVTYYELRGQDALKELLDSTVASYREALELVQAQNRAGVSNEEAVASAETQLRAAEAQRTKIGVLRAQYEHAIALLIGKPSSEFALSSRPLKANPPQTPVGIPSDLLERRPDVAAAERTVAQANAQIELARTAFFPSLFLGVSGGFGNPSISDWFTWPARFWSVGPAMAHTFIDGGARRAIVDQARAAYEQAVANYQQTVLTAFQQVEDGLSALRILSLAVDQQDAAVRAAERNFEAAMIRYKAGIDPYLNVINAQILLLNIQQDAVAFRAERMVASVQLIKALGGSWSRSELPSPQELRVKSSRKSNNVE